MVMGMFRPGIVVAALLLGGLGFVSVDGVMQASFVTPSAHAAAAKQSVKKPMAKPVAKKVTAKPEATKEAAEPKLNYQKIESPLSLVGHANDWMTKPVEFEAVFNSFSPLGLDYKPVNRDSKNYLSLLVLRPDVSHHEIPLSELKMMLPRKKVNDVMELEAGDTILVQGKVFSAALGDPWMDVDHVKILKKTAHSKLDSKTKKPKTPAKK
jgi:hypothetical protein